MQARFRVAITPADVGSRVTLRLRREADDGPTYTDVVGTLLSWDDGRLEVRRRTGDVVTVEAARLVAGRVVPAR